MSVRTWAAARRKASRRGLEASSILLAGQISALKKLAKGAFAAVLRCLQQCPPYRLHIIGG